MVDSGASGELSKPFDLAKSVILAVRFEPLGEGEVMKSPNEIYIDGGLWSEDRMGTLHVAKEPTTSSIYPPNIEFLKQFNDHYGAPPRNTQKLIEVPLRSIDSCVSNSEMPSPNFIKLDIHSSELPALLGAKNSLDCCVGLLVETWNAEVHKGQNLHHEIEKFALDNGFEVYDSICAARWHVKHNNQVNLNERGRYIGSETLLIKSNVLRKHKLDKAFVLSLFGFYSAALSLISDHENKDEEQLYSAIDQARKKSSRTFESYAKKIYRYARGMLK